MMPITTIRIPTSTMKSGSVIQGSKFMPFGEREVEGVAGRPWFGSVGSPLLRSQGVDECRESLGLVLGQVGQRGTNRSRIMPDDPCAGLYDADGVTSRAVP